MVILIKTLGISTTPTLKIPSKPTGTSEGSYSRSVVDQSNFFIGIEAITEEDVNEEVITNWKWDLFPSVHLQIIRTFFFHLSLN